MYLNAFDNQVVPDSEIISLNYLPDNMPLNVKFTFESNISRWTKITSRLFSSAP